MLFRNPMLAKPGWLYKPGEWRPQRDLIELPDSIPDLTKSSIVAIPYHEAMINYAIDNFIKF